MTLKLCGWSLEEWRHVLSRWDLFRSLPGWEERVQIALAEAIHALEQSATRAKEEER